MFACTLIKDAVLYTVHFEETMNDRLEGIEGAIRGEKAARRMRTHRSIRASNVVFTSELEQMLNYKCKEGGQKGNAAHRGANGPRCQDLRGTEAGGACDGADVQKRESRPSMMINRGRKERRGSM